MPRNIFPLPCNKKF